MKIQSHWIQNEPLSSLDISYINEDLSSTMTNFINSGNYKNYYTNHIVIEIYKNTARLFNKNTDEYIGIGFFENENLKE